MFGNFSFSLSYLVAEANDHHLIIMRLYNRGLLKGKQTLRRKVKNDKKDQNLETLKGFGLT